MRTFIWSLLYLVVRIGCGQAIGYGWVFPRGLNASETGVTYASLSTAGNASQTTAQGPCYDRWMSWFNSSWDQAGEWTTFISTYTYHNITASVTTACDGHPRIVGGTDGLTTTATGTNSTLTSMPKNFTVPTPTCTVPPSECTGSLLSWTLCSGTSTQTSDCGPCSIWGGTVELNYFPITRSASQNLCDSSRNGSATLCPLAPTGKPYDPGAPFAMNPCDYKTDNIPSTQNSGPYRVSDGQTFYQNRVYVSLDTVYAGNSCGYVGKRHAGTTLTLASSDIYSIYGYHHELADIGYRFHFDDLSSVPADVYYANCNNGQFPACYYTGSAYRYGTDFLNGRSDIDFGMGQAGRDGHTKKAYQWIYQGAHSPKILVPLQIRTLDPAWAICDLNLVGLYDPPRVLDGQLTYPEPTAPTVPKTSDAAPAATVTSGGAPQTADPKPTQTDEQDGPAYTAPTYTFDPLPTLSNDGDDSGDEDGESPTTAQNPAQETNLPPTLSSGGPNGDGSGSDPTAGGQHPGKETSAPGPTTTDAAHPDADPELTEPSGPEIPPDNNQDSPPSANSSDRPAGGDAEDEGTPPPPATSTTHAVGGIIASVLGALPHPTTTTNALSILESAAQTYAGGQGPQAPSSEQQPRPPLQETVPASQQTALPSAQETVSRNPRPIVFSEGGQTRTLEPMPDGQGVYTIAPPATAQTIGPDTGPQTQSPSAALPTEPMTLTENGYTQTIRPIQGSSGLYTVIAPHDGEINAPASGYTSGRPSGKGASPITFSGPATFVAGDGGTHTILPLPSSSGVFVIDGSRTLTQVPPSNAAVGSAGPAGGSGGSGGMRASTLASRSGELPPVITMTSGGGTASSSSPVGGGGLDGASGGQGDGSVTTLAPTRSGENAASRNSSKRSTLLWILMVAVVICI